MWWNWATDITDKHQMEAVNATAKFQRYLADVIHRSGLYSSIIQTDAVLQRQFSMLRRVTVPPLNDPQKSLRISQILADMEGIYSAGKVCITKLSDEQQKKYARCAVDNTKGSLLDLDELSLILANSRDYDLLLEVWQKWHTVSVPMLSLYEEFVQLSNEGAQELGFTDTADLWLSQYDTDSKSMMAEAERVWQEIRPLYADLHCYVRASLKKFYGRDHFPRNGNIPVHLLGNMWGQEWSNIYPIVKPYPKVSTVDVTQEMIKQKWDWKRMVTHAEDFFVSLGLPKLNQKFWERSLFLKPRDRTVVCHASAWDLGRDSDNDLDARLKMCINVNEEDFVTIHHELGHIFYYGQYADQPYLYRDGANDGFHEGLGDTLALSVTPSYLQRLNLMPTVTNLTDTDKKKDVLNQLLKVALSKVAFLPFGYYVDKWRWNTFQEQAEGNDNAEGNEDSQLRKHGNVQWWALKQIYQGVVPPIEASAGRTHKDDSIELDISRKNETTASENTTEPLFDPGAKYHITSDTPYFRYYLSTILQFQFHKALCDEAGFSGPLYRCSIYGSKKAGALLKRILSKGASEPWQDILEEFTGSRKLSAKPMLEYFQPLADWLANSNQYTQCGWDTGQKMNYVSPVIPLITLFVILFLASFGFLGYEYGYKRFYPQNGAALNEPQSVELKLIAREDDEENPEGREIFTITDEGDSDALESSESDDANSAENSAKTTDT